MLETAQSNETSADQSTATGVQLSRRRATSINFLTQCVNFAFITGQGILLVPLYLRHISVSEYGGWLASSQILNWIALLDPGTDELIRQRSAHAYGRRDFEEVGALIGTGIAINAVASIIVLLAGLVIAALMQERFGLSGMAAQRVSQALFILAAACAVTTAAYAVGSPLLALQRASVHGIIYVGGTLAALITTVAFLFAGWGVASIAAGLLARGIFWLAGWGFSLGWIARAEGLINIRIRPNGAAQLVKLSAFTLLAKVSSALQSGVDGALIGATLGASNTAVYILTGRIIDSARTLPDRIGNAVQPSLAHLFGEGNLKKLEPVCLRLLRLTYLASGSLITLAVVFNRDVMRLWVGEQMYGGLQLTILLGLSAYLSNLLNSSYHVMFASGEVRGAALTTTIQGVVKVTLSYFLLKYLGLPGLPLAAIAASLLIGMPFLFFRSFNVIQLDGTQKWSVIRAALLSLLVCTVAGSAWAHRPGTHSIAEVAAAATAFASFLMVLLYLIHRPFRDEAMAAFSTLSRWVTLRLQAA